MGVGSFLTAGIAVVQALVQPTEVNDAVGFMTAAQNMGLVTFLGVAGALYIIIGADKLHNVLPDHSYDDLLQLTSGIHSPIFEALNPELKTAVVDQVTAAIRNTFGLIMAGSAMTFVLSLFLGVSLRLFLWSDERCTLTHYFAAQEALLNSSGGGWIVVTVIGRQGLSRLEDTDVQG